MSPFSCFGSSRSPSPTGGDEGNRTLDPLLAGQVLSQLSYTPISGFSVTFSFQYPSLKIEQQARLLKTPRRLFRDRFPSVLGPTNLFVPYILGTSVRRSP